MGIFDWLTAGSKFTRNGPNPADLVLVNGNVLTCESVGSRAEAFAVKDGRFVYVGDDAGIGDFIGPSTEVVDARDRVVTPGFIDSHCHILWVGSLEPLLSQEHYNCKSFDQIREAVLRTRYRQLRPALRLLHGLEPRPGAGGRAAQGHPGRGHQRQAGDPRGRAAPTAVGPTAS